MPPAVAFRLKAEGPIAQARTAVCFPHEQTAVPLHDGSGAGAGAAVAGACRHRPDQAFRQRTDEAESRGVLVPRRARRGKEVDDPRRLRRSRVHLRSGRGRADVVLLSRPRDPRVLPHVAPARVPEGPGDLRDGGAQHLYASTGAATRQGNRPRQAMGGPGGGNARSHHPHFRRRSAEGHVGAGRATLVHRRDSSGV